MSLEDRPTDEYQLTLMLSNGIPGEESWAKCAVPGRALSLPLHDLIQRYVMPSLVAVIQQRPEIKTVEALNG
jgi:hypothetical protein